MQYWVPGAIFVLVPACEIRYVLPTAFVDYYLAFYASAYLGVITHWIETGMKESSEEMALIAMRLLFIRPGEPIRM